MVTRIRLELRVRSLAAGAAKCSGRNTTPAGTAADNSTGTVISPCEEMTFTTSPVAIA